MGTGAYGEAMRDEGAGFEGNAVETKVINDISYDIT